MASSFAQNSMEDGIENAVEAGKRVTCDVENMVMCDCCEALDDMPYNTGGCLRCPAMDASFYIQNFMHGLLDQYNEA